MTGVSEVSDVEDGEAERASSRKTDDGLDCKAANKDRGESFVVTDWASDLISL